jgi:hypothetical protein
MTSRHAIVVFASQLPDPAELRGIRAERKRERPRRIGA